MMRTTTSSLAAVVAARAAGALAVAALVAGCMVGPDYERPTAPTPPAYKESEGWKRAEPRDDAPRGEWWVAFGDPELDALVRQVDVSNQTIQAAEAQVRFARAAVQAARAGLLPTVTGNVTALRSSRSSGGGSGSTANGSSTGGGPLNSYNAALDLSWELDLWGKVRRGVEAAETSAQASAADLAAARLSAQATLAQTYLLLRVQDAQVQLLEDTVAAYGKALTLTRNQYNAGVAARGDVAQAESQLNSTQAQVYDAKVTRGQLEHAIAVLVGKPPADLTIAPRSVVARFPAIPPELPSELLERRPDIAGAERRVASANAEIGVAQAAYYPSLSLSATGGVQSSALGDLVSLPARYWALGASLAQTIFDAGLRDAQKAQAVATYDQTVAIYRSTVLTGFQEVEDNLIALALLEREAAVQDDAVKASREAATIAVNQYKAGTANYLAVIVLQAAELNNERTALGILGRRLAASVGLVKALGGGWSAASLAEASASN
ncbi:MAG TPA: efflux transporter outer membrane subunit [Casimicrobiaceae bacterium]|nr:efflux transporter outer membrane subunit [Casimicrobiaceae bacterium]